MTKSAAGESGGSLSRRTVRDVDLKDKRVIARVDFNVPIDNGQVTDDNRIRAALPTLELLRENGCRTVLLSHLGRPKGPDAAFSLAPVARRASEILGTEIAFSDAPEVASDQALKMANELPAGGFLLLENLRFNPGESSNDPDFGRALAGYGELYVDDAFGAVHRSHASVVGIAEHLPAVAGLLLARELEVLDGILTSPKRPLIAILGGSKVSDKSQVITSLLDKCDAIIIGGAMCFTFFKARGYETGNSLLEEDQVETARSIEKLAAEKGVTLHLPTDMVIAREFSATADAAVVAADAIPTGWMGLDIGPESAKAYAEAIRGGKTIFWNGPMGVFEMDRFADGTRVVAEAVAAATDDGAISVVGGGDTDAAAHKFHILDRITHVSTGGGASMKVIEGKRLPGVEALDAL